MVHIGPDPLFARYPLRGFRADIALTGMIAPTLEALRDRALAQAPAESKLAARRDAIGARCGAARQAARGGTAQVPPTLSGKWLSACRITSYNVCYTKLLRSERSRGSVGRPRRRAPSRAPYETTTRRAGRG